MSKMKSIREIEMERAAQPNFGKGITVASGFDLGAKAPLDSRLTVKTIEERNAHVTGNRAYEGMLVYVEADKKTYQLIDNSWEEFGFNEEKFQAGIQPIVDKNTEQDSRLTAIEELVSGGEGLESIIADVAANTAAIAKEVQDRTTAVSSVDTKITAEVSRATAAEEALGERIDGVEADLAEAITNAQADATAKSAQALKDAKAYTDTEITKIDTAYKAADTQVLTDAKAYADTKVSEAKTALEGSINAVDSKVTTLTGKVSANESAISDLRDAISNKNSNTIVVDTEAEIATANATPKVGDLAYVITSKRAYIYKGVEALTAKNAPQGWVVFDEITNELDLVDYLKKSDAESTYRKLSEKIAEADLATDLSSKINGKADTSYVNTELAKKATQAQITEAVNPVSQKANANESAIAQEVTDREGEITRVEGLVSAETTARTQAISAVDTKLTQRVDKFVPSVSSEEPVGTETGHVWLEILA